MFTWQEDLGRGDRRCIQLRHDTGPVAEVCVSKSSDDDIDIVILHPNFDLAHFWEAVQELPGLPVEIHEALERYRSETAHEHLAGAA